MPFSWRKVLKSWLVKPVSLSDTSCSGFPCMAKTDRSSLIIDSVNVDGTIWASIYFEKASTRISSVWLWTGPAWSVCNLVQGHFGYSHGCSGAFAGLSLFSWQVEQEWTNSLISSLNFGHHTYARANPFI